MTEIHYFIEILTGNLLKYKIGKDILILSTCMGKSIRMKRVDSTSRANLRDQIHESSD